MAKTKARGASKLGRDSQPKYLGVKLFSGERTKIGNIIVRQRGTKFFPGKNVKKGRLFDILYNAELLKLQKRGRHVSQIIVVGKGSQEREELERKFFASCNTVEIIQKKNNLFKVPRIVEEG